MGLKEMQEIIKEIMNNYIKGWRDNKRCNFMYKGFIIIMEH